jgi:hypothetical protein
VPVAGAADFTDLADVADLAATARPGVLRTSATRGLLWITWVATMSAPETTVAATAMVATSRRRRDRRRPDGEGAGPSARIASPPTAEERDQYIMRGSA